MQPQNRIDREIYYQLEDTCMKITDLKTYLVDAWCSNYLFVKLETDEGIYGIGECTLEYREKAVIAALEDAKEMIIGMDPMNIENIHHILERDTYWRYGPVLSSCISGIDIALWDLKGKVFGVPVYNLLGGKVRDRVPIYANAWYIGSKTPEDFARHAEETVSYGIRALKWDPFGSSYMEMPLSEINQAIRCVEAVRKAVGPDIDLMIEAHGRFNLPTSVKVAHALEDLNPYFFEEPLIPGNNECLKELRERCNIPIAAGERVYSRFDFARMIYQGCIDYAQPDVSHVGGLTEMKKVAALADSNYVVCAPHNPMGPATNAATFQFDSTIVNFCYQETMFTDVPWRRDIVKETNTVINGEMVISDAPGLGIDLNWDAFKDHPARKGIHLHHYNGELTGIRPENSGTWLNFKKE